MCLLYAAYVSICIHMCQGMCFASANGSLCIGVHVFLEFHTCILCCHFAFCDCPFADAIFLHFMFCVILGY